MAIGPRSTGGCCFLQEIFMDAFKDFKNTVRIKNDPVSDTPTDCTVFLAPFPNKMLVGDTATRRTKDDDIHVMAVTIRDLFLF